MTASLDEARRFLGLASDDLAASNYRNGRKPIQQYVWLTSIGWEGLQKNRRHELMGKPKPPLARLKNNSDADPFDFPARGASSATLELHLLNIGNKISCFR